MRRGENKTGSVPRDGLGPPRRHHPARDQPRSASAYPQDFPDGAMDGLGPHPLGDFGMRRERALDEGFECHVIPHRIGLECDTVSVRGFLNSAQGQGLQVLIIFLRRVEPLTYRAVQHGRFGPGGAEIERGRRGGGLNQVRGPVSA